MSTDETRDGVTLTNLDAPLFEGAGATKRDLVDYLDAVADRLVPVLTDRPLSVIRVLRGQRPFMQKNLPAYTPDWVPTAKLWAESSRREISYAVCNDRRTLLWFANQRAVEYHATLFRLPEVTVPTHLVLDIDPPEGSGFTVVVQAAELVRRALLEAGLDGLVKTSGAKGVHVLVPVTGVGAEEVAAATRALAARAERLGPELATTAFTRADRQGKVFLDSTRAGGATIAAAYSPRLRPGVPVSYPLPWDDLASIVPADVTLHTAPALLGATDPWTELMPPAYAARSAADRGGQSHTDRARPGDARRETARTGAPGRVVRRVPGRSRRSIPCRVRAGSAPRPVGASGRRPHSGPTTKADRCDHPFRCDRR